MRASSILTPLAGFAALLVLACGSSVEKAPPPGTFSEAQALAAKSHKPILIDFFATW